MDNSYDNRVGERDHDEQDHQQELSKRKRERFQPEESYVASLMVIKICDHIKDDGEPCGGVNDVAVRTVCIRCEHDITHQRD